MTTDLATPTPSTDAPLEERLVFLIGAPRSGSTLLMRMLGVHPAVYAPDEPHLITPLAHLGFGETVERAPYDPIITQRGLRQFVKELPAGEDDWWDALRACTDHLYGRALGASGRTLFLDKTPAYALVLDFLARLYPKARFVVLTRHPLAIWTSYVDSFFDGDWDAAHRHNPLIERYVPALARFLREAPVPHVHLRYEDLVREPGPELERICAHLRIEYDPSMIDYGAATADGAGGRTSTRGLGDPVTVARETRPTTRSVARFLEILASDPRRLAQARAIVERLDDRDLELLGHPRASLEAELDEARPGAAPARAALSRHTLERRLLMRLRRNIHHNALGRLVRRVRGVCDVLLR